MKKFSSEVKIQGNLIGQGHPTYFIADIAANHDNDLERAKDLIFMCAEAGAQAAKFQHFTASTIVSDKGFKDLGSQKSHQAQWKKSVFEVYDDASLNKDWTPTLVETCKKAKIDFFTSPYSFELVDYVNPFVPAYKVGSGDVTWHGIIECMAKKGKPMLMAFGASTSDEVYNAVEVCRRHNNQIVIMQCNTNYTASLENFKYIQLNVIKTFAEMFPGAILGLSDHTPGPTTVLGAVTLGARVIEKHFTDSNDRIGPDHKFSMNPKTWKEMVERTRELELSLGTGVKKVEDNERETVVLQRRAIRARASLKAGTRLSEQDLEVLRPCPKDGLEPYFMGAVIEKVLNKDIEAGTHLRWADLQGP